MSAHFVYPLPARRGRYIKCAKVREEPAQRQWSLSNQSSNDHYDAATETRQETREWCFPGAMRSDVVFRYSLKRTGWNICIASPPTLKTQRVATAIANQKRVALSGSTIRVYCDCQPALLICLKPHSIQVRSPYKQGVARWSGSRLGLAKVLHVLLPSELTA